MSCVLRITADRLDDALSCLCLKPYRFERGTDHFQVSECELDNLQGQVQDATEFLFVNEIELAALMATPGAAAVLDFGVEVVASAFRFANFPLHLVRKAGSLGLALELSLYPKGEGA